MVPGGLRVAQAGGPPYLQWRLSCLFQSCWWFPRWESWCTTTRSRGALLCHAAPWWWCQQQDDMENTTAKAATAFLIIFLFMIFFRLRAFTHSGAPSP